MLGTSDGQGSLLGVESLLTRLFEGDDDSFYARLAARGHKIVADEDGTQHDGRRNGGVDVGVFDASDKPRYRKKHRLENGEHTLTLRVAALPARPRSHPINNLTARRPPRTPAPPTTPAATTPRPRAPPAAQRGAGAGHRWPLRRRYAPAAATSPVRARTGIPLRRCCG